MQKAAAAPQKEESPTVSSFSPATILHLQRSIGNRAVANLVTGSSPGVIQRVKKENLTFANRDMFANMVNWVNGRPKLAKVLDMELALLHAPSFDVFRAFMSKIKKDVSEPLPNFNEVAYYANAVKEYFEQNPTPVEDAKKTLAELSVGGTVPPSPQQEAKEEKKAVKHTPVNPPKAITSRPSGRKHFHDMKAPTTLPKSNQALLQYVTTNAAHFEEADDHWTLQLGEIQTRQKGGGFELRPWTIMISNSDWKIFHYGPTGQETD